MLLLGLLVLGFFGGGGGGGGGGGTGLLLENLELSRQLPAKSILLPLFSSLGYKKWLNKSSTTET